MSESEQPGGNPPPNARSRRSRSGSETRRKYGQISFRVTAVERTEIEMAAELAGLSVGSYLRALALKQAQTRATRRATVDVEALTRLQGQMNRVGANIYQLVRRVNFGDAPEGRDYREALAGYKEVIAAILALLKVEL
jgi:hypothetical protein